MNSGIFPDTQWGYPAKERDSNIELFRIITMLLIVAHHYVVNSGLTAADGPIYANPLSWQSLFLLLFGAWGKTGINCFVLITGYFMCTSKISARKFIKLLAEVLFYNLVISVIFWVSGYEAFSVTALVKALLPVRTLGSGFISAFLVFYLFIPFLNTLVRNMNEKQHFLLLLWCGFTYVFLGTIPGFSVTMNYGSWFSVLYVIASFIRLYSRPIFEKTAFWGWAAVGGICLSVLSVIACSWIGLKINRTAAYYFVTDSNTFLATATGLSSFMFFKNLTIGHSRFINTVAASTFGVLLIHANSATMRRWLWVDTLKNVEHYTS